MQKLLAWAQRNERHLGGVLFVFGFITDLLTFTLLDISLVNLLFAAYLAFATVCILGSHAVQSRISAQPSALLKTLRVVLPLMVQYALGGLLSGFLIFYTKSATLSTSWPFILLLAAIFFGNEAFRNYKDRLLFQVGLFFFALYTYAVFAVPLFLRTLGPWVFLGSTLISLALFWVFYSLLRLVGRERLEANRKRILATVSGIVAVVLIAYFTHIVPPIPLSLPEAGIYHTLHREGDAYVLGAESQDPWRFFLPPVYHYVPGQPLYAYASVFAPIRFSASVAHRWEWKDPATGTWVQRNRISFPISGGRQGGYRGYSAITNVAPGLWRLTVETPQGQVIGRIRFELQESTTLPPLREERR